MKVSPSIEILNFSTSDEKTPNLICLYFATRFDEKCPDFVTNQERFLSLSKNEFKKNVPSPIR